MTTTTVAKGSTVSNTDVTSGNELDVFGTANSTTIENGGNQTIEAGGAENNAIIRAGGTEVVNGTINGSNAVTASGTATGDDDFGTINVGSGGVASNITVENGASLNLTAKSAYANGVTVMSGGSLTINGNAPANNVTLAGGTLELESPKADSTNSTTGVPTATGSLTFAAGDQSRLQLDVGQTGTNGTAFAQTISGFASGDTINLKSITGGTITTSTSGGNTTVTVSGTGGSESFTFLNTAANVFTTSTDGNGGTDLVEMVCFTSGTRIRTTRGEVAVEHLEIGDLAVTASGEQRPVKWLGHRTVDCRRHPDPRAVMPIRIAAHAFGPQRPARDLLVSPGHSICIDLCGEVLIPAMRLYNGATISQADVERVTYWHVELDGHDILVAENLACESYIDCGTRAFFAETDVVALEALPDGPALTTDDYCRPFHPDGLVVDFARDRLCVRAAELGWRLEVADALGGLWLEVDGRRVEPRCRGLVARALLPADAREVFLCSDSAVPADMHGGKDTRRLGLQFASLTVDDGMDCRREIGCGDPRLDEGFHPHEGALRWTDGRARLPCELWAGCDDDFVLRLAFAGPALPKWVAPAEEHDGVAAAAVA